jgi:hypothetical protein
MRKIYLFLLYATLPMVAVAAPEVCESGKGFVTPFGRVGQTVCTKDGLPTRAYFYLNERRVVEDKLLFRMARSDDRALWVFSAGSNHSANGCENRHYLVDVSMSPPRVFAFGINKHCTDFDWASWGKKRSVIALKDNLRFQYDNGKLTPPETFVRENGRLVPAGKAIENSQAGKPATYDDGVFFVEEVPLPK